MFEPSVLKKYLDILDITWLITNNKKDKNIQINKKININKFFNKFKKRSIFNNWLLFI